MEEDFYSIISESKDFKGLFSSSQELNETIQRDPNAFLSILNESNDFKGLFSNTDELLSTAGLKKKEETLSQDSETPAKPLQENGQDTEEGVSNFELPTRPEPLASESTNTPPSKIQIEEQQQQILDDSETIESDPFMQVFDANGNIENPIRNRDDLEKKSQELRADNYNNFEELSKKEAKIRQIKEKIENSGGFTKEGQKLFNNVIDEYNAEFEALKEKDNIINEWEKKQSDSFNDGLTVGQKKEEPFFDGKIGEALRLIDSLPLTFGIGDFIDDMGRSINQGINQGATVDNGLELMFQGSDISEERLQEFIKANEMMSEGGSSDEMMKFQNVYEENGKDSYALFKAIYESPQAVPELIASSFSAMLNPTSLAAGGTVVGTSAVAGSVVPGAGTLSAAAASMPVAMGVMGATLETGLTFSELVGEQLGDKEWTPENIRTVLEDEDKLNTIRAKSAARGAIIGIIDAFTGKIAGRIGSKLYGVSRLSKLTSGVTASTIEAIGGSTGEATARLAIGQELDALEIGMEGIAEFPMGIPQVAADIIANRYYKINGEKHKKADFQKIVNAATPEELSKMDINVNNDKEVENSIVEKTNSFKIRQQVKESNPNMSEESLDVMVGLEIELHKLKDNNTESAKEKKKIIRDEIKERLRGVPKSAPETKNENNEKETKKAEKAEVLSKPVLAENPTNDLFGTVERDGETVPLTKKEFKAQDRAYREQKTDLGSIETKTEESAAESTNEPDVVSEEQAVETKTETVSETTETESGAPQAQSEQANVEAATVETQEETSQEKPKVTTVKVKRNKGDFEYDVDKNEEGDVVEIRGSGGRVVPKWTTRKLKRGGTKKVKNGVWFEIASNATNSKSDFQISEEEKRNADLMADVLGEGGGENANAMSPIDAVRVAFSKGASINRETSKEQIGNTDSKWAFGNKKNSTLPSVWELAKNLWEQSDGRYTDQDFRNAIIEVISGYPSRDAVTRELSDEFKRYQEVEQFGADNRQNPNITEAQARSMGWVPEAEENLTNEDKIAYYETQYEERFDELTEEQQNELIGEFVEGGKETSTSSNEKRDSKKSPKEGNKDEVNKKPTPTKEKPKVSESKTNKEQSRIATGIEDLVQIGIDFYGLSKDEAMANAIATDIILKQKAKRDGISVEEMYANIEWRKGNETTEQRLKGEPKRPNNKSQSAQGAMALEEGKYVIYALTNPKLSTPLHELAHVFENSLSKKEKDVVMAAYRKHFADKEKKRKSQYKRKGISDMYEERRLPLDQAWDTEVSEFFARGFEKYLADGKAPTIALKKLFENFKTWLNDIYNGIKGSEIDIKLSPRMIEIYDSMFTGRDLNNQTKTKATILEEGIEQLKTTRKGVESKRFGEILFNRLDAAYNNGEYTEAEYDEREKEITKIMAERSALFQLPKDSEIFKDLSVPRFVVERAIVFLREKYDSGMTYAESLEAAVEYLSKKGFNLTPEQRNKFIDYVDGLVESQKKDLEKERKKNRNKEEQPEAPKGPAQKPQAFTTRAFLSENLNPKSKTKLKELGLNYDVESQDVAQRNAEIIIDKLGMMEAYKMAKEGQIRGGARTWIQAVMFEEINEQVNEAYAKGNLDLVESLSEELGVIMKEFADEKKLSGQEAAMLNRIYQRFNIKYDLDFAKEKWAAKFEKEMTPEVEARLKRQEERIKDLNQKIKELEEKIGTIEEQEAIENIKEALERQKSKFREETKITKRTKVQPIIDKLDAIQKKMLGMSFSDATGVSAIIVNGIGAIKAGIKVGANAYDVIESGINRIKEELNKIGKKLPNEDEFRNDLYDAFGTQEEPKTKKKKGGQEPEVELDENGNFKGIKIPEGLIYELVEGGIDNISDLTTAVKERISEDYPNLSDREVRDAITKYGKQVNETIDPTKQEISRIKTDGKQASILEDLYLGKRPKKSGRKGKKYTEEQRNNLKRIQELLKTIPLDDSVDKEKYYKTALEAYKTRLEKSIADFDQALATNERIINERRTLELDQEAKELVAKRDAKRKEYDEHFGKPFKSNETLIKEIIGRKEKTLKDLEVRLETVKLTGKEMPKKQRREVSDPKIDALQAKIESIREELGEVYELAGIAEAKRLDRAKKYSQRRLDELQEKLKNGDYTKKKPRRIKYDKELVGLKRKLITEKVKFDIEFEKQEWRELSDVGKLGEAIYQAFGVFKGLKATADLSAMLRQGVVLGSRNPIEFAKAASEMHKFAFGSIKNREKGSEYYARRNAETEMSNDYVYMMEDGLSITDMSGDILRSEERFVGKILSTKLNVKGVNVNVVGRITDGSERAYGGFLNSLRVDVYRKLVAKHEAMGYNRQDHPKLYKNIATFVNNATGRGKLTSDKTWAKIWNAVFFSPRMMTGMVGVVRDMGRTDSTPYLRWQAAQSLATFIGYQAISKLIIAQAYQLLVAPFLDDDEEEEVTMSMNAIDTEFNKVKIGNTRYDVSAGYGIAVRTAARFIMDEKITNGVRKDFAFNETEFSEINNFFSNKMSPLARQAYNWKVEAHPTDFTKERSEAEVADYLEAYLMPLSISQLVEGVVEEKPFAKVAFDMTLATYGVGVQEYGKENKKKKRRYD